MRIKSALGHITRTLALRMCPGTDVMQGIEYSCKKEGINNAIILSGIGSLNGARFMNPEPKAEAKMGFGYGDPIVLEGAIEVLSVEGMICHDDKGEILSHIHCTFSDQKGNSCGGHLILGNTVLMTLDLVIGELDGIDMIRKYDDETGINMFYPVQMSNFGNGE